MADPLLPDAFGDARGASLGSSTLSAFPDLPDVPRTRPRASDAPQATPDQAARVLRLQTRTGLPADLIERNVDEIERQSSASDFDAERFRRESPQLARWLAENPQHAALAADDLANLGNLEWIVTAPRRAFSRGQAQVEFGHLRHESIMRDLTADETARLAELRGRMQAGGDLAAETWFGQSLTGGTQQLPMLFGGLSAGARTGLPTAMGAAGAAALAGQLGPQVALPEEIATVPAAALTGYYVGQTTGSMRFEFQQESGHAYEEFSQIKDALGAPLDRDVARAAAIAAGAINAPLGAFQLNVFLRSIPGLEALSKTGRREAIKQALTSPSIRGALKEAMVGYARVLTFETATEVAQRAVTILSGELGKVASGQDIERKGAGEIGADLASEAVEAAQAFTYIAAAGPVVRSGRDAFRIREAKKNEAFFTALGEGVQSSQTFARMPQKLQEFIRTATADGPIETVYVDPAVWSTYWQSQKLDPAEAAANVLGEVSGYEEALRTGHDLAIPMSVYATRLAPTEHNAFFAQELRLGPDEMNAREAVEMESTIAAEAEAAASAAEMAAAPSVRENIVGQLLAGGMDRATAETNATLVESFFGTVAQRAGVDPVQLFAKYGLKIERPMPDVLRKLGNVNELDALLDRLRAGELPTGTDMFGKSLADFIREHGGIRDEGGELKARDAALQDKGKRREQRLVRDEGRSFDEMREIAVEAGYLPADADVNAFMEALDSELSGEPVYAAGRENDRAMALAQEMQQLDAYLRDLGLDLNALSNDEIKATLDRAMQAGQPGEGVTLSQDTGGKRGAIRFGSDRQFNIDLLSKADLSTFIHEASHFYLEVLGDVVDGIRAQDQATLNDQQRRMVEDYAAVLKWLGVESREQITTEQHEQWARGIEAYVMEGKAPSAALRAVFSRFRAWLVSIYRSLVDLKVELTPEVRDVMARLFATDEQIKHAEKEADIQAIFSTAEQAGMSETEFAAYRGDVQRASDTARDRLQGKLMAQFRREREAWWKQQREVVRTEVASEIFMLPEYVALAHLQHGKMTDGAEIESPIKLNRDSLVEVYGREFLKRLPRPYVYAAKGGIHQDAAAELFGFRSGDALVTALVNARPMKPLIEAETDIRMRERYGDMRLDGTIAEEARAAVQNEERSKVIHAEMRALAKRRREVQPYVDAAQTEGDQALAREQREREYERRWFEAETRLRIAIERGERQEVIDRLDAELKAIKANTRAGAAMLRASVPPLPAVRAMAQGRIAQMRIRDIQPMVFWNAARKAQAKAVDAAARDDFAGALGAKQIELLNVELYRAAVDAREDADSIVEYMRSFNATAKRQRLGKAGQDYLDQIDAILDRFSFAPISLKAVDRRKALAAWVADLERQGLPVNFPDDVLDESRRMSYKEMSYEQLVGARDSVRHIEHLARLKNKLLTKRKQQELDQAADEIAASVRGNAKKPKGKQIERLPKDEAMRSVHAAFAWHRKVSSLARQLDGHEDGGAMWEYIVRPLNEAGAREAVMNEAATIRMWELTNAAYRGKEVSTLYVKREIPEIGMPLSKMGRIMVALNWGNADSRQKVMDGYGWTEQQVEAILDGLDLRDWQFVQGVWDFINSYWPEIEAKERRVTGVAPQKVEAAPVTTKFGEFAGGYFPLKYDERQNPKAYGHRIEEMAKQMLGGGHVRATTRRGHTKARVEGVKLPVLLDFSVILGHVNQVIHDLSHHEALLDASRVLRHKTVSAAIIESHGDIVYDQFRRILDDVAAGDVPAVGPWEQTVNHLRKGAAIAAMGWNISTAMLQPFGLTQSMVRVGPKWVAKGMSRWLRDAASMENTVSWIHERSGMMRMRAKTQMREINEIRNQIGLNTGRLSGWVDEALRLTTLDTLSRKAVADSFFWMIYKGQQIADVPTWLGQYEKSMSEGRSEADAIALADQSVLDSQGAGQIKDLAGVQRGSPLLKMWTVFMSYFNVTFNLNAEAIARARFNNPVSVGRLAVDLLLLNVLPATLTFMLKEALRGDGDDDDLVKKLAQENASYLLGQIIGLRELGSVVQGFYGYQGPAGARFWSSASKLVAQGAEGELDAAFWKALNETAGVLFHYPAGQVQRTIAGFAALWEGETRNPLALLLGPPKD